MDKLVDLTDTAAPRWMDHIYTADLSHKDQRSTGTQTTITPLVYDRLNTVN